MKKIAFVCNWGESSADILTRYRRQTPSQAGIWKTIQGIDYPENADMIIVLGGTSAPIDKSKAILIVREPDFIQPANTNGYQNNLTWQKGHCGITWWLSKTYDELIALEPPQKTKLVSCIVSAKHAQRNAFLERLLLKKNWLSMKKPGIVDLYGRGHTSGVFGKSYKGAIENNGNCKLEGLLPYQFSIVLENSAQHNYWTEKLADTILAWCFPIYWGCPNINQFFDPACVMSINSGSTYADIRKTVDQPITDEMLEKLSVARLKLLNEYNIWETIWQLVQRAL